MKSPLGLLFAIIVFAVGIYLKTRAELSDVALASILGFGLIGGALIAFYDRIKSVKTPAGTVELAEQRIDKAAEKAIAKINKEVKTHTEAIAKLTTEAKEQADRIEHLAGGEPLTTIIDGYMRTVMVYTDESGRMYADYTDDAGEHKRAYFQRRDSKRSTGA